MMVIGEITAVLLATKKADLLNIYKACITTTSFIRNNQRQSTSLLHSYLQQTTWGHTSGFHFICSSTCMFSE